MHESRSEYEILQELEKLCTSSGYAHALATLCWRSTFVGLGEEIHSDDLSNATCQDRLLRSELSVLTGLMVKSTVDLRHPSLTIIEEYIEQTEKLVVELRHAMSGHFWYLNKIPVLDANEDHIYIRGKILKEPIFYSSEAAYMSQYRDFAEERYHHDAEWFIANKGFVPEDVKKFIAAVYKIQNDKLNFIGSRGIPENLNNFSLLPAFVFRNIEIARKADINIQNVRNISSEFSLKSIPCNQKFTEIGAFNQANVFPIIPLNKGRYILFQTFSLAEAFYENPFFWMMQDKSYSKKSEEHRGLFTEKFSAKRLRNLFDAQRVYENVNIFDSKGHIAGEIDVLVVYADRAIIIQAKSKKLTEVARKGYYPALQSDFKKSIQHAYDQGFKCAKLLFSESCRLVDRNKNIIDIKRCFAEIFIVCVTSEYYPALAHQTRLFLKINTHEKVYPPYIIDVFSLDVLCELLDKPLHFLSFLRRRLSYRDKILYENEVSVLSHHLAHNLWFKDKPDVMYIAEDFGVHVDATMLSRREGWPGNKTPEGILTKLKGSFFDRLINDINNFEVDGVLELGYFLLEMSETCAKELSTLCEFVLDKSRQDGSFHNFSMQVGNAGITVHSSFVFDEPAYQRLYGHCQEKKHRCKACSWFGLGLDPGRSGSVKVVVAA